MKKLNKKENIIVCYLILFILYLVTLVTSLSINFFLSYNFIFALYFLFLKIKKDEKIERILNIILLIFIVYSLVNTFIGFVPLFSKAEGLNLITELFKSIVNILFGIYLLCNNQIINKKININLPYNILNILELIVLAILIITSFNISNIVGTLISIVKSIMYISLKLLTLRYFHIK